MTFTQFDKAPIRRIVEGECGGGEFLPSMRAYRNQDSTWIFALMQWWLDDGPDFFTLWEVDEFCCRFLHRHPSLVYGETWWDAVAPTFPDRVTRDAYIMAQLDAGMSAGIIARQLALSTDTIEQTPGRIERRTGPARRRAHLSPHSEGTIRALKADLAAGLSRREVQVKYGIPKSTIAKIAQGRYWGWLDVASAA